MTTRPQARILLLRSLCRYGVALPAPLIAQGLPLNLRTVERELRRAVAAGEVVATGDRYAITETGRAAVDAFAQEKGRLPAQLSDHKLRSIPTDARAEDLREQLLDLPRLDAEQRVLVRRLLRQMERAPVAVEVVAAAEAFIARRAA